METIVTSGRQCGKTTKAILSAPKGAYFVWVNSWTKYPRDLARSLGRDDLKFVSPETLKRETIYNLHHGDTVVVDHAAEIDRDAFDRLLSRPCNLYL